MAKKHTQTVLFILFLIIYIVQMVYAMIFLMQNYVPMMRFLFRMKENEYLFAGNGNVLFGIFGFFMWIVISYFLLEAIFSVLFGMKEYFHKINSKENYTSGRYSLGSYKRDVIFCIIIELIALFIFPFTFFYNVRARDAGIIHKRFFSLHNKIIRWDDIESVDFNLEIKNNKDHDVAPQFIVRSQNDSVALWSDFGLGSPEIEELIDFCETLFEKNRTVKINIYFRLDSENLRAVRKYKIGEKNLRSFYEYLLKKQI